MAFNKINKGQPDWHIPLNENFERIENGEGLPNNLQKLDSKGYLSIYPNPNESNNLYKDLATIQFGVNENVTDFSTSIIGERSENKASITMRAGTDDRNFKQLVLNSLAASERIDFVYVTNGVVKYGKVHNSLDFPVESGTWVPTIFGTSVAGNPTYSVREGTYYRQGNVVHCRCSVALTNKGGMAGDIRIKGFPFINYVIQGESFNNYLGITLPQGSVFSGYIVYGDALALRFSSNIGSGWISANQIADGLGMWHMGFKLITA